MTAAAGIDQICTRPGLRTDHEQPGAALVAVQLVHQPVGLVHRLGPGQRHAGEVQEIAAQAAAHHPVGGDR
jgi:hypothetical protein